MILSNTAAQYILETFELYYMDIPWIILTLHMKLSFISIRWFFLLQLHSMCWRLLHFIICIFPGSFYLCTLNYRSFPKGDSFYFVGALAYLLNHFNSVHEINFHFHKTGSQYIIETFELEYMHSYWIILILYMKLTSISRRCLFLIQVHSIHLRLLNFIICIFPESF